MSPLQDYQVGTNDLISAQFQRRFEANFAWVNAAGALAMLPQLRGAWLASSVDENGNMYDLSNQGRVVTNNNAVTFGLHGICPYAEFDGVNQYFSRVDEAGLDLTGALALGGWFRFATGALGANTKGLISKWYETGNKRAYRLYKSTGDRICLDVSSNGTAVTTVTSTVALAENVWYWAAGYYTPSTTLAILVNKTWVRNTTSIPASLYNSDEAFEIGRTNRTNYHKGRASLMFTLADDANEAILGALYEQTRAMFGVGVTV